MSFIHILLCKRSVARKNPVRKEADIHCVKQVGTFDVGSLDNDLKRRNPFVVSKLKTATVSDQVKQDADRGVVAVT